MTHLIPNLIKSSSTDLKKRAKMSHRLLKRLETWVTTFFMILYRLVAFLNISVKGILKILKKSYVSILQSGYIFKKIKQKSKIPLKLCRFTKFQAVWITGTAWKRRWLCAIYCWSLGSHPLQVESLISEICINLATVNSFQVFSQDIVQPPARKICIQCVSFGAGVF